MRAKTLLVVVICFMTCSVAFARTPGSSILTEPKWDGKWRDLHVPILMYHYVSEIPANADATRKDLTVTPAMFSAHMDYLKQQGYHTISPYQLNNALLTGVPLPPKPIVLTFDDGYVDDYLNTFPILRQHGFTATFFIITHFPDTNNPGYMSWDQIRAMSSAGMDIESHTVTHDELSGRSQSFLVHEIADSVQSVAAHTGITPHVLAYPVGVYDAAAVEVARSSNIWMAVTTRDTDEETTSNLLELPRLRMHHDTTVLGLSYILKDN